MGAQLTVHRGGGQAGKAGTKQGHRGLLGSGFLLQASRSNGEGNIFLVGISSSQPMAQLTRLASAGTWTATIPLECSLANQWIEWGYPQERR